MGKNEERNKGREIYHHNLNGCFILETFWLSCRDDSGDKIIKLDTEGERMVEDYERSTKKKRGGEGEGEGETERREGKKRERNQK